tara:strand:+ start:5490 stop:6095 length:606 start_codon:yes stop_codon:yes gene_type:complete
MQFNRAIPGQSLTTPPKSAPYERPPQISDPLEAIDYHLEQLDDPKAVEELMFFLQLGIDLSTLVEGVARKAVLDGIHSIDISLSIAPVIHEYIKGYADALDIDYDEGFEDKEEEENIMYGRRLLLAKKMLADQKERDFEYDEEAGLTKQEGMNFLDERGNIRMQNIPEVEPKGRVVDPDMPVEEDPVLEASNEPKGLMART